ncbi:PRC-barrel domain-containing protein [uncultured Roseobacter sp.]|uniref:PRC-barrel domain-containing protein n=1 Tax=uncultured Roseobacter sp. TaxID=114847 RepID=UPI00261413DD|nr:PRC-barrel domain-containing protein [uncultured Roseobacter sp.]
MTTTALVLVTALPATAGMDRDDHTFTGYATAEAASAELLASDLIGMRVYTSETDVDAGAMAEAGTDWNDIGEVSDVVMTRDGETRSILLDIGGFLGIGEKTVAVNMDALSFVADKDDAGDYFLVFNASREQLENAEPFSFERVGEWTRETWNEASATAAEAADTVRTTASDAMDKVGAKATAAGAAVSDAASDLTARTPDAGEYEVYERSALTAEMLTGAPVYDARDEWIGEVSEILMDDQGEVTKAVLDVGGFLGIGEKAVAKEMDALKVVRADSEGDLRVYVDATKSELEAMPAYSGS